MRFDWKPESKERYFRKAEAAVLCLTCEYYEICKREVNADEYEIRNEK